MARSRDPDKWVGRSAGPEITRRAREGVEGFLDSRTLDGVDSLTYTSAANHYGWTVIVATPKASLNLAARRLTIQAVTAAGVLLLIGLGLGLTVSRRIERPVQALRGAAGALRATACPRRWTPASASSTTSAACCTRPACARTTRRTCWSVACRRPCARPRTRRPS